MALAVSKTYLAAEVLYASDLNTSLTTIHNNALTLISPLTGPLDAGSNDITALDELAFTDATANPTASGRLRRNAGRMVWAYEDARTATVVEAFAIQATTTGTPAAGIGTGLVFRAESGDEAPSDFGRLDFVATDVAAGTEDTVLDVLLRVAGAALSAAWRFVTTAAFRGIFTHANTADRTYTLQDSSDTLVGRATTDTLTNKTLTSPTINTPTLAVNDAALTIRDDADTTKVLAFQCSGITAGQTRTLTVPDASTTIVGTGVTQTLTGKTLGATAMDTNAAFTPAAVSGTPAQHALFRENVVKGWISFNGTGVIAINESFNVTSITDNGTGDYTVTWDRDFAAATYAVLATAQAYSGVVATTVTLSTLAVGTTRLIVADHAGTVQDSAVVCAVALGGQ